MRSKREQGDQRWLFKAVLVASLPFLVSCALLGRGPESPATPTPDSGFIGPTPTPLPPYRWIGRMVLNPLGERLYFEGVDVTAVSATQSPDGEGQQQVTVKMRLKNLLSDEFPIPSMAFALEDEEGNRFRPLTSSDVPPLPKSLAPEREAEVELVFQVPISSKDLRVLYNSGRGWTWWYLPP